MKIAAYQAPLLPAGSIKTAIGLIREQIDLCESQGVEILCCPEGVLGGLADNSTQPADIVISVERGQLDTVLAPLASDTVTTIVGFTEIDRGRLYNTAAIFHKGSVTGLYRKVYPAINRSVYNAGDKMPVFTIGDLTFGIIICNDSNYFEPARIMAAKGAVALFVPTNNALPPTKGGPELVALARNLDIARAVENSVYVIRADVAGRNDGLESYGSSEIVDRDGMVIESAQPLSTGIIVADINPKPRKSRRGWDVARNSEVIDEYIRLVTSSRDIDSQAQPYLDHWFTKIANEYSMPEDTAEQLRDIGYVVIEGAFDHTKCAQLAEAYDAAVLAADPADRSVSISTRVHDFVNRGPSFDDLYIYGPLLAACCSIIGRPFKLSSMLSRTLEPGASAQGLHVDFKRYDDGWPMIGFIVMIDDFRTDNGATRFVPGSHTFPNSPDDVMEDMTAAYGGEGLACGPAGSMIIYNGSIWHGFTANRSTNRRRSIQGAFIRREAKSGFNQPERMRPETLSRIGDLAKYLLTLETTIDAAS